MRLGLLAGIVGHQGNLRNGTLKALGFQHKTFNYVLKKRRNQYAANGHHITHTIRCNLLFITDSAFGITPLMLCLVWQLPVLPCG